jgi:hypothetical protein
MNTIKTKLHNYKFDLSTEEGRTGWLKLKTKLEAKGLKVFESCGGGSHYNSKLGTTKTVELEVTQLFDNQWNTAPIKGVSDNGLRVFDWALDYMPQGMNQNLKRGHWLEQTTEMQAVRDNTTACGYCGKQEPAQKGYVFCPHCIDSEYLEKGQLHLTRMKLVSDKSGRAELTEAESSHLIPLYVAAQSGATSIRAKARITKKRQDLKRDYDKAIRIAETEFRGFSWLMDNGLNIDNVIYYSHTDCFNFGWRKPVDAEVVSAILEVISEFPFQYEIVCADGQTLSNHVGEE